MALSSNANRETIVHSILLMLFIQLKVQAMVCPITCDCKNILSYQHTADCRVGNNTIRIVSETKSDGSELFITCSKRNFECADLPNFQIGDKNGWSVIVLSCTPKILACVSQMLSGQNIKKLNLTDITGSYIAKDIKGFQRIEELRIYFRDTDNEIPYVILNYMPFLAKITTTTYDGELTLKKNMFCKSNLEKVVMKGNHIIIPDDTFNGSRIVDLELINLNINHISVGTFRGQNRLENLAITSNGNLKYIEPQAFSGTPKLKCLSIMNAALEILPNGLFLGTKFIQKIYINNNAVTMSIEPLALHTFEKKEFINDKILSKTDHKKNNRIKSIDLINNNIEILPQKLFSETTMMKVIRLKSNKIKVIPEGLFLNLKNLEYLDLSDNNIIELPGNLFDSLINLETAELNGNNITELDLDIFNNTRLRTLKVASNKLQTIKANKNLRLSIVHLNISYNQISVVQDLLIDSIVKMMNKKNNGYRQPKIDLSHNKISNFIKDEKRNLKKCFHINFFILLSNNPFECTCIVTTVLNEWYKNKKLLDYAEITCSDGKKVSSIDVQALCNGTYALIALVGSSCVVTFIISLCLFNTIMSRKKIKTNIKNFINSKDNTNVKIKELDEAKTYDVFISFAHQENEIVSDILLPKLEKDFHQKVCVHYRDWIVGQLIPDQIIKSVDDARKTIILLTENFLASEWAYLEFHAAHTLELQEHKPKLIVILFDESIINDERLDAELKSHIVINNYLIWNNPDFWKQLQQMLPRQGKKR